MVSERGVAPSDDAALPENVQGIVAARLDALSAEDKKLIQDAAVLGKVFWSGALAVMNGLQRWTVEESLHRLERKEFVRRERRSSVATETEYAFRHVLVRDVAYGQVPRALRAEKHRLAAEWIEALSADREDRAEMLAHHYLSALEFARAAGQEVEPIAERARVALREAGDRAYMLSAFAAAASFYRGAVELWPLDDPERGHLLLRYGRALFLFDWRSDVSGILEEARDLLLGSDEPGAASEAEVALGHVHWYRAEGDLAIAPLRARGRADRTRRRPLARRRRCSASLPGSRCSRTRTPKPSSSHGNRSRWPKNSDWTRFVRLALNTLGVSRVKLGDPKGLADIEHCLEITEIGSYDRLRAFINLASTVGELGDLTRSVELHEEGLLEAERFGGGARRGPLVEG